jgi:hypothetical protein
VPQVVNTSSFRVQDLKFADFDGNGSTDVFGVVANAWRVSYGATSQWTFLRSKLTNTVGGLVVGDFDGDGRADVATSTAFISQQRLQYIWAVSHDGIGNWKNSSIQDIPITGAPAVGRFLSSPAADVLTWSTRNLYDVPGAVGAAVSYSRQDMR